MPIYDFECGLCRFTFEKKQRFDDEPLSKCPKCQGEARRVFHPVPIIFKGSGFYITDNRKDGDNTEDKAKEGTTDKVKEKDK